MSPKMSTWLKLNISPIDKKSDTVSTLRQSPCSSLVTFVPCPRKRVFVASSAFLVKNCFVILSSNFIYFTRPSNSSDSVISLTDSLWQNSFQSTVLSKSSENSDTTFWLDDVLYSPDKGTDPDAAVGCLETYCKFRYFEFSKSDSTNKCIKPNLAIILFLLMFSLECMKR